MKHPRYLVLVAVFCGIVIQAQTTGGGKRSNTPPKFEDYPEREAWHGPPVPVRITSPPERLFRTQLREAAKQLPNFAGHYRFTFWGCGTRCAGGALVDLRTGSVFPPPLGGKASAESYWIFCTDWDKEHGAEYYPSSRLFVFHCGDDVHYFVWENNRFRQVLLVPEQNSN